MIHARTDYDRFQDPALTDPTMLGEGSTPIAADEPVMLFRAKDALAPFVVFTYADWLDEAGQHEMARVVERHAERMCQWQTVNGCKMPDMPEGAEAV